MTSQPAVPPSPPPSPPAPPPAPKTSGLAVASLVCGVVGPCTLGLSAVVGIILGIVALPRIRRSGGAMGGRGLAIAGIVVSAGVFLLLATCLGAFLPWFWLVSDVRHAHTAGSMAAGRPADRIQEGMHDLCLATLGWSAVNDGRLPPPDDWPAVLKDCGAIAAGDILVNPDNPHSGRAFAMNALLAGVAMADVRDPGAAVLYFECADGAPPGGGATDLAPQPRGSQGYVIAFCDGRVEPVPENDLGRLVWDPKAERPQPNE